MGRPSLPNHVKQQIVAYLKQGKSYRWICNNISYKGKYGKIKHQSLAFVSQIANCARDGFNIYICRFLITCQVALLIY